MKIKLNEQDLSNRAEIARLAVVRGKEEALKYANNPEAVINKQGTHNFATQADIASNKVILNLISSKFPQDTILSEETENKIKNPLKVDRLWVIDPLDGTNNFRNNRRYSAVSVAYVEKGVPLIGAIIDIFHNDLYLAQKGSGATLNNHKIHVSTIVDFDKATIASDNSYDEVETRKHLQTFLNLPKLPWIILRGSAVLVYCEVARGSVDAYFEIGVRPWDNAAAHLLITEAGGVFYNFDGIEAPFTSNTIVVGNKKIVESLLPFIVKP